MINNNIFTLFKEFSKEDLSKFKTFLISPYHNKSKKVIRLFEEIQKFYPDFSDPILTKIYLSKKINPDLKFHDSTIRDIMADLLKLAEEFLLFEELKNNKTEKDIIQLKVFTDRNQTSLFEKHFKNIDTAINKEGIDSVYFYHKSRLDMYSFNFNIMNRFKKSPQLIEENENFLISYIIDLLNYFITEFTSAQLNLSIYRSKFKLNKNTELFSKIFKNLEITKLANEFKSINKYNFIIDIYLNLFKAFQDKNEEKYYYEYKFHFLKHIKQLSDDEKSFHFSMLISYCIYKISSEKINTEFDTELFNLYETFLKGKYFIDNKSKYIEDDLFRNILLTALRIKKYKWVLKFIKIYSKYIHPDKKENLRNLSYAEFYYHSGVAESSSKDLSRVFEYLKEIREDSFIIKYDIKSLYLMLYYDLNYFDTANIQIEGYRKFLKRNKLVSERNKIRINNFLNLYEKLIHLQEGDYRKKTSELHSEILKSNELEHRVWLLKRIESLEI